MVHIACPDPLPTISFFNRTELTPDCLGGFNFYTYVGDYDFKDKPGEQSYMLEFGPPKNWKRGQLERPLYNEKFTEAFRLSGRLRK